jgi:SAM-dependent methyltransferase
MRIIDSSSDYFVDQYRDYEKQNSPRKLDHYLDVIDSHWTGGQAELLDVGCGLGSFLERAHLRHPAWLLHGTDINRQGVEATQARVPSAVVTMSSADTRSHPAATFDLVTAWDVVEHVAAADRVADSIDTMLRPGGLFFFVVPVYDGMLGKIVERLDQDPTHIHKRGRDFWLDWAANRFEILEWHGIFRYLVADRWYAHIHTRLLRRQGSAVLIACRKRGSQVS